MLQAWKGGDYFIYTTTTAGNSIPLLEYAPGSVTLNGPIEDLGYVSLLVNPQTGAYRFNSRVLIVLSH